MVGFSVPRSSHRTSDVGDYESTDVARNIGSMLRFGKISAVNVATRLCSVELPNSLVTDELPWVTLRAGGNVFWAAPTVGEVCLLIAPSGELNNAIVLPALQFNDQGTWPFDFSDLEFAWGPLGAPRERVWRWLFSDGAILENDPDINQYRIEQRRTRIRGSEILNLRSEKYIYVEADQENEDGEAQGIVHIKAPMIKLEGDVHITGQLMQSGRIIGISEDGGSTSELSLVGDPILLNSNGGVLGMAASLLGTALSAGLGQMALGQMGTAMATGTNGLVGGLTGLAENVLGVPGMSSLFSNGLSVSSIASAITLVGSSPVLAEVMNEIGFSGQYLQMAGGAAQLVAGVTTSTGLDMTASFQGLSQLTGAIGAEFDIPELSAASDLTALPALATAVDGGQLTINDVIDIASGAAAVAGYTPTAEVSGALDVAMTAANAVIDAQTGGTVAGPTTLGGEFSPTQIMEGLLSGSGRATAEQIASRITELGLATNLEALTEAGCNGSELIGMMVSGGQITMEQVLGLSSIFANSPDAAAMAGVLGLLSGTSGSQKFFDYFDRAKPGEVPPRDMQDAAGSETDPHQQEQNEPPNPPDAYDGSPSPFGGSVWDNTFA